MSITEETLTHASPTPTTPTGEETPVAPIPVAPFPPMSLTVRLTHLRDALSAITPCVTKSQYGLPILKCVCLRASKKVVIHHDGPKQEQTLTLEATNLEVGISLVLEAHVEEEGAIAIPLVDLLALVKGKKKKSDDAFRRIKLTQQPEGHTLSVETHLGTSTIQGMDAAEFPSIPTIDTTRVEPLVLESKTLKQAIALTAFAAADDDSRPVPASVYLEPDPEWKDVLHVVTGDAFRLAHRTIQHSDIRGWHTQSQATLAPHLLVPTATMSILAKLLPDSRQDVFCYHKYREGVSQQIGFTLPIISSSSFLSLRLMSRTIEGTFPNYRYVQPRAFEAKIEVEVVALLEAYKYLADLVKDASNITRLQVLAIGEITLSGSAEGRGERSVTLLEAETLENEGKTRIKHGDLLETDSEQFIVYFNYQYLLDFLKVLQGQKVERVRCLLNRTKPSLFQPVGTAIVGEYSYIGMPMHINR